MSISRGIRGAITVDNNSDNDLKKATTELLAEIIQKNSVKTDDISHVIFTLTKDLNVQFPAKYAREYFDWTYVPMMCYHELDVPGSLKKCLRVLLVVNTEKAQNEIKHIYLKGAAALRPDIV